MFKIIFEGQLDIFVSSDVDLNKGQLVKLDPANEGKILPASAGDVIHGMVAQDVRDGNIDNFKLDSVTHVAKHGDKVGVYIQGGMYYTDQYTGNVTVGAPLYSGANGKFSLTVPVSGDQSILAYAQTAGNSANGDRIRIEFRK